VIAGSSVGSRLSLGLDHDQFDLTSEPGRGFKLPAFAASSMLGDPGASRQPEALVAHQ
jgi:hypothetical protein